jgi:hypothetical protein
MTAVKTNSAREAEVTVTGEALKLDARGCMLGVALLFNVG